MERLYLPDYAWFCFCDTRAVFADLRNDVYLRVNEEKSAALREIVESDGMTSERVLVVLDELIQYGLLTPHEINARPVSPTTLVAASVPLLESDMAPSRIGVREIANFLYACVSVDLRLRGGQIFNTVTRVNKLRSHERECEPGMHRLRELAGAFRQLRPLYPRKSACLFDTLALIEFLSRYKATPTYVAGVNNRSGEAHCWAQLDELLILDDPERVAAYTAIVVV